MDDFYLELTLAILCMIMAFVYAHLKAKAVERKDEESSSLYGSAERIFLTLFLVSFMTAVLFEEQTLMAIGFAKVFRYLEVLTNG